MKAASFALDHGVSVVIANGQFKETNIIKDILKGKKIGTFFTIAENEVSSVEDQAIKGNFIKRGKVATFLKVNFCNSYMAHLGIDTYELFLFQLVVAEDLYKL